jgi:enoyl-CoA hydratase/methylglutaconyl-CoA hydratase
MSLWMRCQSATDRSSPTSTKRTSSMCGSLHRVTDTSAETPAELVHLEVADRVATITLDSPHNRNALSRQLVTELFDRLDTAEADEAVTVVVIRSSGRVFCSGADLSEATSQGMEHGAREIVRLQRLIVSMTKPVVVEVGGPVRAGGIGIVAAADIAVAAEDATFALTEVKLGLAAAIISLTVHHRMSPRAASLTTLGGEVFSGTEAAAYGLATRAVPGDRLEGEVQALCAGLATGAAQGLRESKRILNRDLLERIDARGEEMAALSARLFASDEAKQAMTAFLNRAK